MNVSANFFLFFSDDLAGKKTKLELILSGTCQVGCSGRETGKKRGREATQALSDMAPEGSDWGDSSVETNLTTAWCSNHTDTVHPG